MDINLQFCHYSVFIVHKINSCNNATQLQIVKKIEMATGST